MSISERDAALDELRQTLRSLPSGQRGGYLKSALQAIQLGAPTTIAALQPSLPPSTVVPARATLQQQHIDPAPPPLAATQESPHRTRQEMTHIAPANIFPTDVCPDKANHSGKSINFKNRMREATRMLEV